MLTPQEDTVLLSDEEIRRRMSAIEQRYPGEREALKKAYAALMKIEARTHLAITFREIDLLSNADVKQYLTKAKTEGMKLTAPDIKALVELELEDKKIAHDLAKFDCDTSDKDFAKLQPQLSYYQSEMKLQ